MTSMLSCPMSPAPLHPAAVGALPSDSPSEAPKKEDTLLPIIRSRLSCIKRILNNVFIGNMRPEAGGPDDERSKLVIDLLNQVNVSFDEIVPEAFFRKFAKATKGTETSLNCSPDDQKFIEDVVAFAEDGKAIVVKM